MINERRFILKGDAWTKLIVSSVIIKQWFIRWNDSIQDTINIRLGDKSTHRVVVDGQISETLIDKKLSNIIWESDIGSTKTRYILSNGLIVDVFDNKEQTTIAKVDKTVMGDSLDILGQEVTDHSYYKNDYLISHR